MAISIRWEVLNILFKLSRFYWISELEIFSSLKRVEWKKTDIYLKIYYLVLAEINASITVRKFIHDYFEWILNVLFFLSFLPHKDDKKDKLNINFSKLFVPVILRNTFASRDGQMRLREKEFPITYCSEGIIISFI